MSDTNTRRSENEASAELDAESSEQRRPRRALQGPLTTSAGWVILLDIALVILFTAISPSHVFWSLQDFQSLMLNGTEALMLALALTMLLGAGIFDLSLGANLVLSSVIGAKVMLGVAGTPLADGSFPHALRGVIAGLIACLVAGVLFGLINGLIVAYLDVNSLIATLGTLGIATGAALIITNGTDISGLPPSLQNNFGLKTVAQVPAPAIIAFVVALLLWLTIRYLRYGVRTLAIGSSRQAAERAGLPVRWHLISLFLLAGLLAAAAGFVDIAHYSATTVNGHAQDALTAFTAAVIGGTVLEGGRVSIVGTVAGSVLAVLLLNGLIIIGISSFWQLVAVGCVLIFAVAIDRVRYRRRRASH